ncbi:MAG: glycosyltransferase [Leptolyngbyaceae cyanobacterium]
MTWNLVTPVVVPTGDLQITARPPQSKHLRLSLVIPTYNERDNLIALLEQLVHLLDTALPNNYELIVVDDNSPDATWRVGLTLAKTYPQLKVMRRMTEKGLSSAVVRGWQVADGQILGVIDADLQHPPDSLLRLLESLGPEIDLAVASRHVEGGGVSEWSFMRRTLSRGAQILGLVLLPDVVGRVSDPMSGYFLIRREAIAGPILNPKGYKILLEVLGRGQVRSITEVGYVFQERFEGESKVTWRHYLDYLHHLIRLRIDRSALAGTWGWFRKLLHKLPVGRFLRFATVGFSGVFVDFAVFYFLFNQLSIGLIASNVLSAETAIFNNFLWNDAWTFADLSQKQLGWHARGKRFLKFNLICLAGIVLNTLVVKLLFAGFGVNAYIAKLIAIAVVTIWNFWVNLKLSWRVTEVRRRTDREK